MLTPSTSLSVSPPAPTEQQGAATTMGRAGSALQAQLTNRPGAFENEDKLFAKQQSNAA